MKSGIGQVSQDAPGTATPRCVHLDAKRSAQCRESTADSQIAGGSTDCQQMMITLLAAPNASLSTSLAGRFISIRSTI